MFRLRVTLVLSLLMSAFAALNHVHATPNINSGGVNEATTGNYPPTSLRYWSIYGTGLAEHTGPPFTGFEVPTAQTFFDSCAGSDQESYNTQSGPGSWWYESPLQVNFYAVDSCSSGTNISGRVYACISGNCDFEDILFNAP